MAVPASITYVNIQGTYVDASGQPMSGRVIFAPEVDRLLDEADNTIVLPSPVAATLDSNGHFTASLMVSDDPDVEPEGWTYKVREQVKPRSGRFGGSVKDTVYSIEITASMAPGPVYLSDIDPSTPIVGSSNVYVRTINGQSGVITLDLADLGAGNSATRDVGTTAGTVAAGDDSRLRPVGTTAGTYAAGDDSRITSAVQVTGTDFTGQVSYKGQKLTGLAWFNVREYGAVGNNTADDTAAIQAAINALPANGGTVYFPPGQYKVTSSLTLRSKLTMQGDSDGGSELVFTSTSSNALVGSALERISLQNLWFTGPGQGSGSGNSCLVLTKGASPCVPYISIRDCTIYNFGQDGIAVENAIVSVFERVVLINNGRYGANFYGQVGGSAGTSLALNSVYGNYNGVAGIRIYNMVYVSLNGCAGDGQPIAYLIDSCQSVTLNGCGAEANVVGLRVTGGYGVTVNSFWVYDSRGVGIDILGTAHTVTLTGAVDNTPGVGATNFIKIASGSQAILMNCSNTSPNSIAYGTAVQISPSLFYASDAGAYFGGGLGVEGGNLTLFTPGTGVKIPQGTNATMGRATLVAGTVTVATTKTTAISNIFLTCQTPGGTPGFLRVSARTAATSFTITSSSGSDTSVVGWIIVEPT